MENPREATWIQVSTPTTSIKLLMKGVNYVTVVKNVRRESSVSLWKENMYLEEHMVLNIKMGNGELGRTENWKRWVKKKIQ